MASIVRWASAAVKSIFQPRQLKIAVIGYAGAGKKTLCRRLNAVDPASWGSTQVTFEPVDVDYTEDAARVRASAESALHALSPDGADGLILLVDGPSVYAEDTAALKNLFEAVVDMCHITRVLANKADKVNKDLFSKLHDALGIENPHDWYDVKFGTCVAIDDPIDDDFVHEMQDFQLAMIHACRD